MGMFKQPTDGYLHELELIYGLPESAGYWQQKFKRFHIKELGMSQWALDPCLFFHSEGSELAGLVETLVDDTFSVRNRSFTHVDSMKLQKFDEKPKDKLPFKFGGVTLNDAEQFIRGEQDEHRQSLKKLNPTLFTPKNFSHSRGHLSYIAHGTRPDVVYSCARLSQLKPTDATPKDAMERYSIVDIVQNRKLGITFPKLNTDNITIRG